MHANTGHPDHKVRLASLAAPPAAPDAEPPEADEGSCPAFGFLRGLRDRALTVEFRFRVGNALAMPYTWLGPVRFDPSVGLDRLEPALQRVFHDAHELRSRVAFVYDRSDAELLALPLRHVGKEYSAQHNRQSGHRCLFP